MTKRHTILTDEIFKNSKYIDMIQRNFGIKDFKKESKNKESKYFGQYEILIDIYQTFILTFNCFYSDSNVGIESQAEKARIIIQELIYKNDVSQKHKYSVDSIKYLCDKRARRLYKLMEKWQKEELIDIYTYKDTILTTLKKEMDELELAEFDCVLLDNISYKKNHIKNYKQFTKYISKFDNIYLNNKEFKESYKNNFYEKYGIKLDNKELNKLGLLFKLLSSVHNGLDNIINDYQLDEEITLGLSADELYKIYLKSNNIDYVNDNFLCNSNEFICYMGIIKNKIDMEIQFNNTILIERFDLFFFNLTMEHCFYSHKIKVKSDFINKLLNDLIDIYKKFLELRKQEKNLTMEEIKEQYFIPLYSRTSELIKRYGDVYERIS